MVEVSAPGKLFLFGEYGVLGGGVCIVVAVDRRVTATYREDAPGYQALGADFGDTHQLPDAVLATGDAVGLSRAHFQTDVRALIDENSGEKLGLGSSAASAVALAAAYRIATRPIDPPQRAPGGLDPNERLAIFEHAFRAHRALQNGRGSGADIAASTFGHVIAYQLCQPTPGFEALPQAHGISWDIQRAGARVATGLRLPAGLRIEPIWLGRPARSTSFVRRCELAIHTNRGASMACLAETSAIAEQAFSLLASGDPPLPSQDATLALVDCVARADASLERLGALIQAPIITDAHRLVRACAAPFGIALKPSGAGGGDFSLAFGADSADWTAFFASLPPSVSHLPLQLGAPGIKRSGD